MKTRNYLLNVLFLLLLGTSSQAQWIQPAQYQQMLGSGMDVDWWNTDTDYDNRNWDETISDYNDAGIQHVRIPISNDYLTDNDFRLLDMQINRCISYGITPIITYRPSFARGRSYANYHSHITNWWRIMAEHYRHYPARLSFDIIMEPNSTLFASYTALNDFYEDCVSVIRRTNPYRIIFIAPSYNSDPLYLQYLRIPSCHNGYLMAEWHFLSQNNYQRAWNNWQLNRAKEQRWIQNRIDAALAWQRRTGIYTWVGGWYPGSYFNSPYSDMQDAFTNFYYNSLYKAGIPFAIRGVSHLYNYRNREWNRVAYRPMRTIFPRGNFAHSGIPDRRNQIDPGFSIGNHRFSNSGRMDHSNYRPDNQRRNGTSNGFHIGNNNERPNNMEKNNNSFRTNNNTPSNRRDDRNNYEQRNNTSVFIGRNQRNNQNFSNQNQPQRVAVSQPIQNRDQNFRNSGQRTSSQPQQPNRQPVTGRSENNSRTSKSQVNKQPVNTPPSNNQRRVREKSQNTPQTTQSSTTNKRTSGGGGFSRGGHQ